MQEQDQSVFENICKGFISEFNGILSWKWDGRFETVIGEFNKDNKDKVHNFLIQHLGNVWNNLNIDDAPDSIKIINRQLGGLEEGQILFTSDPEKDDLIFCAWWPWGDDQTISIRIAPSYNNFSELEKTELVSVIKSWFGI